MILLPDPPRRAAAHIIVVALIIAALAPQAVASTPTNPTTERLLEAVEVSPAALVASRGVASIRGQAAWTTFVEEVPAPVERFHPAGVATPPSVIMEATVIASPLEWVSQPGGAATISGRASWYCCTRGWGDAAVVALPIALGGHWTTPPAIREVVVCADRCARLPVGDACACHWGQVGQKVVDLSPAAWAAVTDKDRWVYGVLNVTLYLD